MKLFKIYFLIAIFVITGIAIAIRPRTMSHRPTEAWLETLVPQSIDGFVVSQVYKMDPGTYSVLKPYGIVSRFMSNGTLNYDSVFLASDNSESFHDPRVCFNTQYNDILSQETDVCHTKTLGNVPTTVLLLKDLKTQTLNLACYAFKGPGGYFAEQDSQHFNLFKYELMTAQPQEGAFYRIIDLNGTSSNPTANDKKNMLQFLADYLDAIHTQSKGRF